MTETHFRAKTLQRSIERQISLSSSRKPKIRFSPTHLHSPPEIALLPGVRDLGFSGAVGRSESGVWSKTSAHFPGHSGQRLFGEPAPYKALVSD